MTLMLLFLRLDLPTVASCNIFMCQSSAWTRQINSLHAPVERTSNPPEWLIRAHNRGSALCNPKQAFSRFAWLAADLAYRPDIQNANVNGKWTDKIQLLEKVWD